MNHREAWPTTRVTLLARIRDAGDESAWRTFVELYAPLVYSYCCRRGFQHADAQNVSQEVFSRVSRSIRNFEYNADQGQFRAWLGLLTHQQMLRYRQRQARDEQGRPDEFFETFEGEAEGAWIESFNAHIYSCALANVRPEFDAQAWRAFERVWDGRERPGDVARDMQKEPHWVYQIKHRVVERLKVEISRLTADVAILYRH
jgi:RNA polymerase sigma-70 factor (ECF subfamily)